MLRPNIGNSLIAYRSSMKVLYVATEASAGMVPFAVTIINTMAKSGKYEIHAIVVNTDKLSFYGKFDSKVQCTYISESASILRKTFDKLWFSKVIRAIEYEQEKFKPNVIHFLTADFRLGLYSMFNSSCRKKFCYTVHDLYPHERTYRNLTSWLIQRIMAFGCMLNRKYIPTLTTCSAIQLEELKSLYPKKNIHFTHFPTLVTDKISDGIKHIEELENIEHYILFFGSIDKYKGVDILVEAYSKSTKLKRFKLVIAGKDRNHIIQKNNNIICIDRFIENNELKYLFNKADIVVYPYRSATMSGVLSIALFFQKKIVLSDIPFFREYECEATTFFKKYDVNDLRATLEMEVTKNRTKQTGYYEIFFSPAIMEKDYDLLYHSITDLL